MNELNITKRMSERQVIAFENPCYSQSECSNPIYSRESSMESFTIKTKLKLLAFTGNELWNATVWVYTATGVVLGETELSDEVKAKIRKILDDLLESVGNGETTYFKDETDFEAGRMCSALERKKLPRADLESVFKFSEMQQYARSHPNPDMGEMLLRKHTHIVDFGGVKYSMILTCVHNHRESNWHASISILNEKDQPMIIFTDMPAVYGEMALKLLKKMLNGIGIGEFVISKPKKGDLIFNLYRKMSKDEINSLPKNFDFILGKPSPAFAKRQFN